MFHNSDPPPSPPAREGDRNRILFICYYSFLFHSSLIKYLATIHNINSALRRLAAELPSVQVEPFLPSTRRGVGGEAVGPVDGIGLFVRLSEA